MTFARWMIIIAVIILILLLAIAIGWSLRNNRSPQPVPPSQYTAPLGWLPPTPGPDPDKNTCQIYTFPTGQVNVDGVPTALPGTPSLDANILNGLTGTAINEVVGPTGTDICLDTDQIAAQQLQHVCGNPARVADPSITRCDLMMGGTTGLGGVEVYYADTVGTKIEGGCPKIPDCAGELSLVSINFGAPTSEEIKCLKTNGVGLPVTMEICDPGDPDQLFRVTRINPGQNPNSIKPGRGQNGLFAQILDRRNNTCLTRGTATDAESTYRRQLSPNPGCQGGNGTRIQGNDLTFAPCTTSSTGTTGTTGTVQLGSQFPGYNWALFPSVVFPSTGSVSPPQIFNIENLDFSTFPGGLTGGITGGVQEIFDWFEDNNGQAIYYGGEGFPVLPLRLDGNDLPIKFGIDVDGECYQQGFTAQYLNLTTYNIISTERVCFADGTLATPQCTGL